MELRKDYILDRWTYISEKRETRPHDHGKKAEIDNHSKKKCPFCFGKEHLTPKEIGRVEKLRGKWLVRWIPNKYPSLIKSRKEKTFSSQPFFKSISPFGLQEIIIETPGKKQMFELSIKHLSIILKVYNHRIEELSKIEGIEYVLVFKNKGKEAGASLVHSHSQVMATGKLPAAIEEEVSAFGKYKTCPYCHVIEKEKAGPRKVFENDSFIAFTPYAPRFNYEIWLFPKEHMRKMKELKESQYFSLAEMLNKILVKINEINAPYCFYIQYGPEGKDFHWHMEILPRTNIRAGFELSGGDTIISVSPERAARFYRNESDSSN